jgi:hypothetical protein
MITGCYGDVVRSSSQENDDDAFDRICRCATLVYDGLVTRNYFTRVDGIPPFAAVMQMVATAHTARFGAASPNRILP